MSSTALSKPAIAELAPEAAQTVQAAKHSYRQILKSSALIGGSSAVNIVVGIVRTKVMAILLGPSGVGLFGIYNSISDLSFTIAGMGVNSSGVRQIAEAAGSDDPGRIALTAAVLRRASILLGLFGSAFLVIFAKQVSRLTFGSDRYTSAVALLSIAVLFRLISAGQGALIQGMRRIADLASMGVLGAVLGIAVSIPVVYFFREAGIVPSLIGVAAVTILSSWWYSRKIHVPRRVIAAAEGGREAFALLKLGFAFMASGLMTMGAAYLIRIAILRRLGVDAAGLYQSAWMLAGLYVGFILQAMAADFYPRLSAQANNHPVCNRIVNEQAHVGLLLAGPGATATLTFAPAVIAIFYTAKFYAAVEVLRWICLGTALQVITWPMGFIIVAKGKQSLFFWTELAWTVFYVALAWWCVRTFGLNGAGIAFFGSYVFHVLMIYPIVRKLSGFRWSAENKRTGWLFLSLIGLIFTAFHVLRPVWAMSLGIVALLVSAGYSLRTLADLVSLDHVPRFLQPLIACLRPAASKS